MGKISTPRPGGYAKTAGGVAEELAAAFLERHGLVIVLRNYRCRGGEVDLICRDRRAIVFVEVRLRSNPDFGGAAASITRNKQARIILAAEHYLTTLARTNVDCRFDCLLLDNLSPDSIEWIRDAFSLP
ncbi:MAG: YraN family protein [Candidatus Accumulibacter sp.]|uniref:YraN family protein n=1 Tax=Accumulibacter sp. TaxID=2053492 RepID=UPI00287A6A40|nr:YraN family protein [Accumulibacter sp.]MDS4013255.1 YraN family protein [Accumulibacter sp.]